jgi:hypothetical protein
MNVMSGKGFLNASNLQFLVVENSPAKLLTTLGVVTV